MIATNSYLEQLVSVNESSEQIDLSTMRLAHGYSFRVLQDVNGNCLFELIDGNGNAYMAFLFRSCPPDNLDRLRDAFSTCWYSTSRFPLTKKEAIDSIPVISVEMLPSLAMWEAHTSWNEDAFWAKNDLLMEVTPMGMGCSVEIMCRGERSFAYVRNMDCSSTDESAIEQALAIRKMLKTPNQIKIQTRNEGMTVSWYIPLKKII